MGFFLKKVFDKYPQNRLSYLHVETREKAKMTTNMQHFLTKLRQNVESVELRNNGEKWGEVYLPNVGDTRRFAGTLSALAEVSMYEKIDSDFGLVRIS